MKRQEFLKNHRSKTLAQLDADLNKKQDELLKLRKDAIRGKIKSSATMKQLRRDMARIKTIMIEIIQKEAEIPTSNQLAKEENGSK